MELRSFFYGAGSGFLSGLFFIVMLLRWGWRNRQLLRELVREIYHIDLLNFIDRIEGLLNLALIEYRISMAFTVMYIEKAIDEVRSLKNSVTKSTKKYEHL